MHMVAIVFFAFSSPPPSSLTSLPQNIPIASAKHLLHNSMQRKDVIKLATKTITARVDENTKTQAEAVLNDIGLNLTEED
jgi:outer membrane PBP1 activator LpoA protein